MVQFIQDFLYSDKNTVKIKRQGVFIPASFLMFINKNLKEAAFNYCVQWSGVADQKIGFFIISMGVMSHTI